MFGTRFGSFFLALVVLAAWPADAAKSISLDLRPQRPNFIVIIADDMAWDDCGAYGHPTLPTPSIDRLAEEGMKFNHAFVTASSCSPSRASIITGRYPHATGAEQLHWPLPRNSVTFVNWLRQSGYWTAAAGKWHLGNAVKSHFNQVWEARGRDNPSGCGEWLRALRSRPKNRPFFLWLASFDPHRDYDEGINPRPVDPAQVELPPYVPDRPEVRKDFALYYDEIRRLDSYVGLLMSELEAEGVSGNTCLLFLSDNGRPFPRDKCTLYDGGIKTPFIVWWPSKVKGGSVTDSIVSTVDIAPTLLELAGVRGQPSTVQGTSFAAVLDDPSVKVRDYAFAESHWHDFEAYGRAVRDGRYKYIRNYYFDLPLTPPADALRSPTFRVMQKLREEGMLAGAKTACFESPRPYEELYDTRADVHETRNLINDPRHLSALRRMRQAMDDWREKTRDFLPAERTPDEFNRDSGAPLPNRIFPRIPPPRAQYRY